MKYLAKFESFDNKKIVINIVKKFIEDAIDRSFNNTMANYIKEYINVDYDNNNCKIEHKGLQSTFLVELLFLHNNQCKITQEFSDCKDAFKKELYETLDFILNKISYDFGQHKSTKADIFYRYKIYNFCKFDINQFIDYSSNIESLKNIKKFNL